MPASNPTRYFPCASCGAKLEFAPGARALKCPYCGVENVIDAGTAEETAQAIQELDFLEYLKQKAGDEPHLERQTVKCPSCGAASALAENVTADRCPFCAAPLVAGSAYVHRSIRPRALAPFIIKASDARQSFQQWLGSLWFAPNALQAAARAENALKGIYLPYWTYAAKSESPFTGERGEVYDEEESYVEDGKQRSRQVERIRWFPVSGKVSCSFDDILVAAANSVPKDYAQALSPWRLDQLTPYRDDYVSGFTVEAYQVGLEPGFGLAQQQMEAGIRDAICREIGGAQQRILSMAPTYSDITFKHILLPIWLSTYRYADKTYRFLVNGQSGAVRGERPWSAWKIAGAVVLAIVAIALFSYLKHHVH